MDVLTTTMTLVNCGLDIRDHFSLEVSRSAQALAFVQLHSVAPDAEPLTRGLNTLRLKVSANNRKHE
jgi:hypothetical protein